MTTTAGKPGVKPNVNNTAEECDSHCCKAESHCSPSWSLWLCSGAQQWLTLSQWLGTVSGVTRPLHGSLVDFAVVRSSGSHSLGGLVRSFVTLVPFMVPGWLCSGTLVHTLAVASHGSFVTLVLCFEWWAAVVYTFSWWIGAVFGHIRPLHGFHEALQWRTAVVATLFGGFGAVVGHTRPLHDPYLALQCSSGLHTRGASVESLVTLIPLMAFMALQLLSRMFHSLTVVWHGF